MHRIRNGRLRRLGVFAALTVIAALAVVSATSASVDVGNSGSSVVFRATDNAGKVFVCKYVGTPGVNERLQTGGNPIDVSINTKVPDAFAVSSMWKPSENLGQKASTANLSADGMKRRRRKLMTRLSAVVNVPVSMP